MRDWVIVLREIDEADTSMLYDSIIIIIITELFQFHVHGTVA